MQYFAAVEPQKRLATHIHIAIRGTISRSELRRVLAATYRQVWWPDTGVKYGDGDQLPVWHDPVGGYVDPATGEVLPTWDEALDAIGPYDLPWHVARFGDWFDAQGVIAGSPDAARCIGYLTKYLTKHVGGCHQADTDFPASPTAAGPTLAPEELAGRKLLALFDRAAARDFADVRLGRSRPLPLPTSRRPRQLSDSPLAPPHPYWRPS